MSNSDEVQRTELLGGMLLIAAAALAMILANSPWAGIYDDLLDVRFELRFNHFKL
jgi:NhaA family Na+:H+ antiporter